jgi:hypothetical protein
MPVSHLREAMLADSFPVSRFGGRGQVGKDHAQTTSQSEISNQPKIISL